MNGHNWIGQTIAERYQIEDLLGQGGMSAVYSAYDPNLRRKVAIKLIHTHLSNDPNFIGRFKEEAAAIARLRHPNIVQVFDFNVDNGIYYMVMEYLAGETLQTRLRRLNNVQRNIPLSEAVNICIQLCDAAGYAHIHELVHRDIKPANVMLDINDRAILMDFGIVKIIGGDYHTATGATIGTAMYMPPEQIRSERVDDRSDIYSLGVTLYEMISGQPPYQADSAMTIMMMVLNDPLPDLRNYRKGIPDKLLAIVNKALAKEPSERFQSMEAMSVALQELDQESLKADLPPVTLVDDRESERTVIKSLNATRKDSDLGSEITDSSNAQAQPITDESEQRIQAIPETPAIGSSLSEGHSVQKQMTDSQTSPLTGSSKIFKMIVVSLFFLSLITAIILYIYKKPPAVNLTPISQPQTLIDTRTAQSVVNLGMWDINSHIEAVAFSPDSMELITANNRDSLPISNYRHYSGLWYVNSGVHANYFSEHSEWVYDVAFTADGQYIISASDDGTILLWEIKTGDIVRTIAASFGGFTSLDISPNDKLLAAGSWDGKIGLWQLDNGNLLRTLSANDHSIRDVVFSPDGKLLAAGSDDNTIYLWRVSDGSLVHSFSGHTNIIYSLDFSPDGALLASGSEDYSIRIWGTEDGSWLRTLQGHTDSVFDVAFSPDGSLLASGSADGTLLLWRVDDGQLINTPIEYQDYITSVAFSPDGYRLVSGAVDGILQFWGISQAIPIEPAPSSDSP